MWVNTKVFRLWKTPNISCSKLSRTQNPLKVIEALRIMSKEVRTKLQIDWYGKAEVTTGNTEIYDKVDGLIRKYDLSDCICLHGESDEIYKLMYESDVVGLLVR